MRKTTNKPQPHVSFQLNNLQIGLLSNSQKLIDHAISEFLGDWTTAQTTPQRPEEDFQIHLELVEQLSPAADLPLLHQGDTRILNDGVGTLSVYKEPDGFLLHFLKAGQLHLKPAAPTIRGLVTEEVINYHRLHDLVFTSLASFLRQNGRYLIHGSAAVNGDSASIFVGPLATAKSTTVLNLAFNGWGLLSDDTILLEERPDGIYALPTPGGFSIRPQSIQYIPALADYTPKNLPPDSSSFQLSPRNLNLTWAEPAPVSTIYFPTTADEGENQCHPLPKALALAHLMELSLDRWDKASLPAHITFLETLSRQAKAISLKITNQQQVPALLRHH